MSNDYANYIKVFLIYAFLGWALENFLIIHDKKYNSCNPVAKAINQKFCVIPFNTVYGFGGIFILLLWKYLPKLSLIAKAFLFLIVFTLIELIGGFVGEHVICKQVQTCRDGSKIWNYNSDHNINGYVDLKHSLTWVALGLIGYYAFPYLMKIPTNSLILYGIIIWIIWTIILNSNLVKT